MLAHILHDEGFLKLCFRVALIICFSSPLGPSFYASSSEAHAILFIGFTKAQSLQSLHGGKVTKTLTPSLYSRRLFDQVKQKESMRLHHSVLSCTWSTPFSSKGSSAYHIMHDPVPRALHIGAYSKTHSVNPCGRFDMYIVE